MQSSIKKALPVLITALVLWTILVFTQKPVLLKTGDLSLFLFDWTFLKESFMIPGGFLGWAGSFFTQFLYIPWLGSLLWVLLLVLSYSITKRVFDIPSELAILAAIPAALLLIANMSLGYGMFIMRQQDYFFAPTLGYLLIIGISAATKNSNNIWKQIVILTVSAFAGFFLAGVFALIGVLTAGILVLVKSRISSTSICTAIVSLILFIAVPFILYGFFYRYRLIDSWTLGLPSISDSEWTDSIRLPFWILFGYVLLLSSCGGLLSKTESVNNRKLRLVNPIVSILVAGTISLVWYKDSNFKAELEMSLATDRGDWHQVVEIYRKASTKFNGREKEAYEKRKSLLSGTNDPSQINSIVYEFEAGLFEPTRLMVMFRDLALLKQGKALDVAFSMRDGGKEQKSLNQVPMAFQAGRQLYMNYGVVNMAYRWCLEDQVEHGWCFGTLKYMATYATLMNETEFAAKYLDKLDKTLFYRKWSRKQRYLSEHVQDMVQARPYKEIIPLMSFPDQMSNDRVKCETYLMSHFADDRGNDASPEFDQAALFWAMRTQNIDLFWNKLAMYFSTFNGTRLPRHVQEAILLYSNLEKRQTGISIDDDIVKRYESFQTFLKQSSFHTEQEAKYPIWLKFGDTFYYYYYFVRGLKTF